MFARSLILALSLAAAAPLMAQETTASIDSGMTHDDVVKRLGKPLNERVTGTHTYMFYRNGCEKTCGMNDLVVLEDGKVIDAVFRNGVRSYSGSSTSPMALTPAHKGKAGGANAAAGKKGVRGTLTIPAEAKRDSSTRPTATITGVQVQPAAGSPAPALTTSGPSRADSARRQPADSNRKP